MVDFDADGIRSLSADFHAAGPQALTLTRVVVRKVTEDVERDAKILAPVDTGNLRNSISSDVDNTRTGASGVIGPTANYAGYVEFGTSRMAPQPYMGPALDRHADPFERAIAQIIDKAL